MSFLNKNVECATVACRQHKPWNKAEIEYLKANYATLSNTKLSKALFKINPQASRSSDAIKAKANKLKLNKGFYWTKAEIDYLTELIGEYPINKLIRKYQTWAKNNKLRLRSPSQIRERIKNQKDSLRLNASSKYITTQDLKFLLGCDRTTAHNLFKTYKKELNTQFDGTTTYVSRAKLRRFLLNHQDILERYQKKLNIRWLIDILRSGDVF